ncbi:hypothetical protein RBH76_05920 [Oscillospiraceae bacterium MB24-C1]|nr:hypothetical protein RBH76_05920 [Oscillospiraceae bacterium MB24-C1]
MKNKSLNRKNLEREGWTYVVFEGESGGESADCPTENHGIAISGEQNASSAFPIKNAATLNNVAQVSKDGVMMANRDKKYLYEITTENDFLARNKSIDAADTEILPYEINHDDGQFTAQPCEKEYLYVVSTDEAMADFMQNTRDGDGERQWLPDEDKPCRS